MEEGFKMQSEVFGVRVCDQATEISSLTPALGVDEIHMLKFCNKNHS